MSTPHRREGSAFARPIVWAPLAVLLLAAIGWIVVLLRDAAAASAQRAETLAAVDAAVAASPADPEALSRAMARLQKLPDHDTARDLLAAAARIELARDRADRAYSLFAGLATQPGAAQAEQRLGSVILLRHQEAGAGDPSMAAGMLRQVIGLVDASAEGPDDLLRGWQAASRLGDQEVRTRFAALLRERHAGSPAARLLQFADNFDPKMPLAELDALRAEFTPPPAELDAMRVIVVMQSGDSAGAVAAVESLLGRAPGARAARMAAMAVFHACALGETADPAARQQWIDRRNSQIDWLLERTSPDDKTREMWSSMRTSR